MANETPFYERTLDSFSDETITSCHQSSSSGLWYAVLDVGPETYVSDPDFSTCAKSREEAIRICAEKIRNDQKGIGKYAPHSILLGYAFHFRLCEHWAEKERNI